VLVLEAAGGVALPDPFVSSVSLAIPAVLATADGDQCEAILPEVVRGRRRLSCAVAEWGGRWSADSVGLQALPCDDGYVLDGTKLFVPGAADAHEILVVSRCGDGLGFFLLPRGADGLVVEPMRVVDRTRPLDAVHLRNVRAGIDSLLGRCAHAPRVLDEIVDRARVGLAALMVGAADRALAMTVEYVALREQFGRAIATFQAVQHRCADMKVAVEQARSLVYHAAWAIDSSDPGARLSAAVAKSWASQWCPTVVADAIQLHGGIGFTWEHDLQVLFKRVKADEATYGDAIACREVVARILEETA